MGGAAYISPRLARCGRPAVRSTRRHSTVAPHVVDGTSAASLPLLQCVLLQWLFPRLRVPLQVGCLFTPSVLSLSVVEPLFIPEPLFVVDVRRHDIWLGKRPIQNTQDTPQHSVSVVQRAPRVSLFESSQHLHWPFLQGSSSRPTEGIDFSFYMDERLLCQSRQTLPTPNFPAQARSNVVPGLILATGVPPKRTVSIPHLTKRTAMQLIDELDAHHLHQSTDNFDDQLHYLSESQNPAYDLFFPSKLCYCIGKIARWHQVSPDE